MYSDPQEIKDKHKGDIPTLWKIYVSDKPFYKNFYFKISIGFSITLTILSLMSHISSYTLMIKVINTTLNILPNLLGFNLGAYILIVGFGGTDILATITKPLAKQSDYSFYQKLNGVLGIAVIVQIVTLVTSFSLNLWDSIQADLILSIGNNYFIELVSLFGLFIVVFLVVYSIILLVNVVKHVFMFAQTIHFCIYTENLRKKNDNENKKQMN